MKSFLTNILKLMVVFLLAYFVVQSGWVETVLVPQMSEFFTLLSNKANDLSPHLQENTSLYSESDRSEGSEENITSFSIPTTEYRSLPESIDEESVRSTILQLTNDLRNEKSLESLTSNNELEQAANIRALETESNFSHTRPDGREFYTTLNENDLNYSYAIAGENLAMATHHLEDKQMAEFLFNGWVESPGHYENLVKPEYREIGIGVHFDGEILYLVQIFGTPY